MSAAFATNTVRLPVGGVDDKVWRGAIRFPLDELPAGARDGARLELYFDGPCVAPRRKVGPCPNGAYTVDAHAILSPSWTNKREVDFDPVATASTTVSTDVAAWTLWELTGLVSDWAAGAAPNGGILLKLAEGGGGLRRERPVYIPSGSFGATALRPRLVVSYTGPTTGLSP
jgi:hypothetical protein